MAKAQTTEKRGPGRPASFPGLKRSELATFASTIPVKTRDGLKALAAQREIPLNTLLNDIAEKAIAASERARKQNRSRKQAS